MKDRKARDNYQDEIRNLEEEASGHQKAAQAAKSHSEALQGLSRVFESSLTGENNFTRALAGVSNLGTQAVTTLDKVTISLAELGTISETAFQSLERGLASSLAATLVYGASFGNAMDLVVKHLAASITSEAALQAMKATALGFLRIAEWDFPAAAAAFTSAAEWGAIAGVAGIAGSAMPNSSAGRAQHVSRTRSSTSLTDTQAQTLLDRTDLAPGTASALQAPVGNVTILVGSDNAALARYVADLVNTHVQNGGKVVSSHSLRPAHAGS